MTFNHAVRSLLLSAGVALLPAGAHAQVPLTFAPGFVVDTAESIGVISDNNASPVDGGVALLAYTVPAGRSFHLTDLSVDPRNANTSVNPCFFEVWRGDGVRPLALAWSRTRIFSSGTYDRSWVTGPEFAAGESVWVIGRFDRSPGATLRLCTRATVEVDTQLRYALRGYVVRRAARP